MVHAGICSCGGGGGEEQQLITIKTLDRQSMRFTRPWMIDRFGRLIQRTIAQGIGGTSCMCTLGF
ncbi:hypothetical protein T11_13701 [Trichinella zimbabwensis]|uniref:Uncharacterized protein n=1 Tax=Trichinella zimbabwensis TaxID=268475 RepID=A0A0V1H3H8_9BILA|nr:hypothetical protein T11_13701 [Trichinella zimbabwensis]